MKMQLKRIVSAVCAVALCASVVSTPVLAADDDGTSVPGTTQSESSAPEETTEETTASEETNVENKQPADTVAEQPANDQEQSANDQEQPANDQEQSANDQEQPANDQEQPGNNVQESADNVQEQPVDNEAGPAAPSNDGAATPSVMSYNGESQEVHVNDTTNVTLTAQWKEQDPGTVGLAGDVDIDKTASEELVNDEADVTLSIGGTQEELEAYVLFVLDKSTSTDVRDEAAVMLDELMKQVNAGYSINVGVISFEREVDDLLNGWMELNKDGYQQIVDALNTKRDESGTNIYLGLREAKAKMDALTGVDAAYKHIVLVTDGITYLWSNSEDTSDTKLYSIYSESISYTEESINAGMDMIVKHHPDNYDAFVAEFADMKTWMQTYGDAVAQDIATYQHVYGEGQYKPDVQGQQDNSTYNNAGFDEGDYIPGESLTDHYSANEAAVYMATTVWQEIVNARYHAYAYADVTGESNSANAAKNPWAANFISGLGTIGGNTGRVTTAAVDGMFDDVKSSIIYAIDHGTVTDVIGDDFDLTGVDSFKLKVGDEAWVDGTVSKNNPNEVTFEDGKYVVTYIPADGTTKEQFVWEINTPVQNIAPLQLTYKVKLVNAPTDFGDYDLPTNEEATLEYTSTTDGTGSEDFPVPTVPYSVIKVNPASLTIYMGGTSGYESIVDENGNILENVSLPEPGFYLDLPTDVNEELRKILGAGADEIIDLSEYVTLSASVTDPETGEISELSWTLERYGYGDGEKETSAGYIDETSHFIYKIVPDGTGAKVRVKVSTQENGSDKFDATEALFTTYDMEIYGDGVDEGSLTAQISIEDEDDPNTVLYSKSFGLKGGDPATLTVRYVTGQQEDVVTDALNDIGEAEDPSKAYVVLKDLNKEPAEDFIINQAVNGLTVQADPDSVALLFDDIVSSDDTKDDDTHFEQTLVENAVKATNQSFQNLQYQAKYLDLVDANNGNTWLTTNDKVTVYWPYPEGTNASTKFYLQHFEGIDRDATLSAITGEVKTAIPDDVMVHTGDNGIYFETDSFSPYVLMWDKTTPAVDDGGKEESTPAATPKPTPAPAEEAQPVAAPVAAVIPQTGDDSQPLVWVALVVVSGAALAGLAVYRKKRSDK